VILGARTKAGVGAPEITDSERRHADVVKFGVVKEVDYSTARVRVTIGDEDDENGHLVTGWLPMAGGRARGDSDWHPLEEGERVMVLSESGELQNGMVLPAGLYSDEDPAPGDKAGLWRKKFADGATLEYDRESGELAFTAMQQAVIKVGGATITVTDGQIVLSAGGVTFTVGDGEAVSSGPIRGQDGLEVTGGEFTHNGKNVGSDHTHTGVEPGGGLSGPPE
jgi:phage baseplate assembly protein V